MLFYWSLWAFFLLLTLSWHDSKGNDRNSWFMVICMLILAVLTGGRERVGSDWGSYKELYNYGISAGGLAIDKIEPLYRWLIFLCKAMGFSYGLFCAIVSFISLIAFLKFLKLCEVKNYWFAFLVYLSLAFCSYQFNIVRHGVMSSFALLGFGYLTSALKRKENGESKEIIKREYIYSIVCFVIGAGVHYSGTMFIALIPFMGCKFKLRTVFVLFAISFFLFIWGILSFFNVVLDMAFGFFGQEGYLDIDKSRENILSIGTISKIAIFVYVYYYNRKIYKNEIIYRVFVNMLFFCLIFIISFSQLNIIIQRLGNTLSLSLAILFPFLSHNIKGKIAQTAFYLFFCVFLGYYYYLSWGGGKDGVSAMLPFTFVLGNLFN